MKVTFLRHGFLASPYDHYESLSLTQLSLIARQLVEPTIDVKKLHESIKHHHYSNQSFDTVLVSPSQRAKDTAASLMAARLLAQHHQVIEVLREILFDPAMLVSEKEYQQNGLAILRERLFLALATDQNFETGTQVVQRVKIFATLLQKLHADSILVVTHGFLLRYLDIYFRQRSTDFSFSALRKAKNYDYLTGFSVSID